ncbi:MAG: hypothetical protein D3906_04355 [Candidatus Electrothrix sp. AUS1_2]|nr:hypothetical protein [Candidatus Electrothrix sp. AUS1_2]
MHKGTLRKIARIIEQAGNAINELDSDIIEELIDDDVDVPVGVELLYLAEAIRDLASSEAVS